MGPQGGSMGPFNVKARKLNVQYNVLQFTVEPVITHTPQWMAQAMGYYRLWAWRGMLKIGSKNYQKIGKID
jgi:hypothetical protein